MKRAKLKHGTRVRAKTQVTLAPNPWDMGADGPANRDRVKLELPSIYRAELAAGVDWAVRAKAAVEAAGCKLSTYPASSLTKKAREIYAHSLIKKMILAGEDEVITIGLDAIRRSIAGSNGSDAWTGQILCVWLPALATNQTWLRLPLSTIFDQFDWEGEYDDAKPRAKNLGIASREIVAGRIKDLLREHRRSA